MLLIKYTDGQTVNNPSDWSMLSSVPIRFLEYQDGNRSVRLIGYESYVKFEEVIPTGSKIILVGKNGEICDKITIMNGNFNKREVPLNAVYNNQPVSENLWKTGFKTNNPSVSIK